MVVEISLHNRIPCTLGSSPPAAAEDNHLTASLELAEAGKLTPVIDRTYPLRETPAAPGYIEGGHVRGKVVIMVEHNSQ